MKQGLDHRVHESQVRGSRTGPALCQKSEYGEGVAPVITKIDPVQGLKPRETLGIELVTSNWQRSRVLLQKWNQTWTVDIEWECRFEDIFVKRTSEERIVSNHLNTLKALGWASATLKIE